MPGKRNYKTYMYEDMIVDKDILREVVKSQ